MLGKGYDIRHETIAAFNRQIEENIKNNGVVVSIGCSTLQPGDEQLHDIFERADHIMYERKKEMKAILGEIQDGTFKKQFADENATDAANLKEMRAAEEKEDIEVVGKRLRIACGLQKEDE